MNDPAGILLAILLACAIALALTWRHLPKRIREPIAGALAVLSLLLFIVPTPRRKKAPTGKKKSDVLRDEAGRVRLRANVEAEQKAKEIERSEVDNLVRLWNEGRKPTNDAKNREE